MILYVNERNEIRDVDSTNNPSLIPIEISNTNNPFANWNKEKICCYRVVKVENGRVKKIEPYVDKVVIDRIERLGKGNETNANDITDTQIAVTETYEKTLSTEMSITDIQLAIVELYEMILGGM